MPSEIFVPRSIPLFREGLEYIDFHVFGDASKQGVSAVLYAVVHQHSGTSQGFLASKSRLSKKGYTIPRLELIACHMAANLLSNARNALKHLPIRKCQAWSDSTVALYWILSGKEYKPVVNKQVRKIKSKENIEWNYVNTKDNPADLGSRGCHGDELLKSFHSGPEWLTKPECWPEKIEIKATEESEKEAMSTKKNDRRSYGHGGGK